jgi:hypothetical protein
MTFHSPNGDLFVRINMVVFVDDSTCITGGTAETTYEGVKSMMQQDAQLWHDLLWVTGGKLELPKCGYHMIYYDFLPSGIPVMRQTPADDSVILRNEHGTEVPIIAKDTFTPRKNLGHYKQPAENKPKG